MFVRCQPAESAALPKRSLVMAANKVTAVQHDGSGLTVRCGRTLGPPREGQGGPFRFQRSHSILRGRTARAARWSPESLSMALPAARSSAHHGVVMQASGTPSIPQS